MKPYTWEFLKNKNLIIAILATLLVALGLGTCSRRRPNPSLSTSGVMNPYSVSGQTQTDSNSDAPTTQSAEQDATTPTLPRPASSALSSDTLPSIEVSDAAKQAFMKATGLSLDDLDKFRFANSDDLNGKIQILHGFDPTSNGQFLGATYEGTPTDSQILEYLKENSGLSAALLDNIDDPQELKFQSDSPYTNGKYYRGVDPTTGQETRALLFKEKTTGKLMLLGLTASPAYFSENENPLDSALAKLKVAP